AGRRTTPDTPPASIGTVPTPDHERPGAFVAPASWHSGPTEALCCAETPAPCPSLLAFFRAGSTPLRNRRQSGPTIERALPPETPNKQDVAADPQEQPCCLPWPG